MFRFNKSHNAIEGIRDVGHHWLLVKLGTHAYIYIYIYILQNGCLHDVRDASLVCGLSQFLTAWRLVLSMKTWSYIRLEFGLFSTNIYIYILDGRKQVVKLDNVTSESCEITCGVPQGSVLGFISFQLFIDGKFYFAVQSCAKNMSADDVIVNTPVISVHELECKLHPWIDSIPDRYDMKKLCIDKWICSVRIIGSIFVILSWSLNLDNFAISVGVG